MATEFINDPRAFRDFLDAKLSNGGATLTLDEVFGLCEQEHTCEDEREATTLAIGRGLADLNAGRTKPADDVLRALARKHGISYGSLNLIQ